MIKVYYENKKFAKHIEYSFKVLGNCCGQKICFVQDIAGFSVSEDKADLHIAYGSKKINLNKGIHIIEGNLFREDIYRTKDSLPQLPLYRYEDIPILYRVECIDVLFSELSTKLTTGLDIVQSTFFLLTNYEEDVQRDSMLYDIHGRIRVENITLYEEKCFNRPIINEYAELLCNFAKQIGSDNIKGLQIGEAVHITHDVDYPYDITLIDRIQIVLFNRIIWSTSRNISYGCMAINEVETTNNIISSWYFKSKGTSKYDDRYNIQNKKIKNFVDQLVERGCEIGYHYSYNAALNEKLAIKEGKLIKEKLGLEYLCGRNHFLRYSIPESIYMYEKLGVLYDTTQGAAACEGFARGICIPYKLFLLDEGRESDVWEIPLLVMDGTLRGEAYRNYTFEEALNRIKELLQTVKIYSGVFTILWHNTSIDGPYWREWYQSVYLSAMEMLGGIENSCMKGKDIIDRYNING